MAGRKRGWARRTRLLPVGVVALVVAIITVAAPAAPAGGAKAVGPPVAVRVDQVGYPVGGPKVAEVLSTTALTGTPFTVQSSSSGTVYSGVVGADRGKWNGRYQYVLTVTFTPLAKSGTDRVVVQSSPAAASPPFTVGPPATLWSQALDNALGFYQNEQDGPDYVPSPLRTAPAHLNDEHAEVYATPRMNKDGGFSGDLASLGQTMDASGGWWDAGDYLKFVETTSYAVALLGVGARSFPASMGADAPSSDFLDEFRFGIEWLEKMWDDSTLTLYYQVGIGEGNATTVGDHDIWRLPQADDTYGGTNPADRYIRNRPVFEAGPAGSPVSPNLAGRLAADFGLCTQLFAVSDPSFAAGCLKDGEDVYGLADTHPKGALLTTAPHSFYPETQWRDDLELGATELAAAEPPGSDRDTYLADAAHWAAAYLASPDQDSLNLYDVSGLAEYELASLLESTGATGLAVTPASLTTALHDQIEAAVKVSAGDPFGFGVPWGSSDTVSHGAGLSVMASEYDALTGTSTFAGQAQGWVDNILGDNAWGVSFVVGDGTTYPDCMQDQVANLMGSTNGAPPILAGAAVEGPTRRATHGTVQGMVACPAAKSNPYKAFNGQRSVYTDNVVSYSTDEPAIDLTAATPLAFAWLASSGD